MNASLLELSMPTEKFFEETREQSVVKATIVEKYFDAWANIMVSTQKRKGREPKIGYVDLFAGPGRYQDGAISTPLRVLQQAIESEVYAKSLVTIFNDIDSENVGALKREIEQLPGVERLKHQPVVWNHEVGDKIAEAFAGRDLVPVLAFIDPWGYKGLTLKLVHALLKDWGCDCVFFFNYNRINAGITNKIVRPHMDALFGSERANKLRETLPGMDPLRREATIIENLVEALGGGRYVLPFCFKNEKGTRTKHHLILVTKHFKGYEVMKSIMAKSSSTTAQGVPSFTFCPAHSREQPLLFELNRPLDELGPMLLEEFAGKTLTMKEIYERHSVGRPFISSNYKKTLRLLEDGGLVRVAGRRSKQGFADYLKVSFPRVRPTADG